MFYQELRRPILREEGPIPVGFVPQQLLQHRIDRVDVEVGGWGLVGDRKEPIPEKARFVGVVVREAGNDANPPASK